MSNSAAEITTVFDADNHYWETSDAFTRYRDPKYADRGVQVKEVDGRMRYVVHGELHPWIPGPGDANPRPKWVASVLKVLRRLSPRNEATRGTDLVAQFHEHVWVAPFVEDSVPALIEHMPVERILFGSDYPHAEGFAEPKEFFAKVADLSIDDQRKIMRDNARELTFT